MHLYKSPRIAKAKLFVLFTGQSAVQFRKVTGEVELGILRDSSIIHVFTGVFD